MAESQQTTQPEEYEAELAELVARTRVQPDMSFKAAFEELQALVAELENDTLDVDELTEKVARANALADHCRC